MSRIIKTVKCLMKHKGKTVHVVSDCGYEFDAVVTIKTGGVSGDYPCLYTTDKAAEGDKYWWPDLGGRYGHACAFDRQITGELKCLTFRKNAKEPPKVTLKIEKPKKKRKGFLTKAELDAARGHFCLLEDGSKGFICQKTSSYTKPTRVLHNGTKGYGWTYTDLERREDDAPEAIKYTFSRAYNVNDEEDATAIKVVEVLEKYDGRHYRYKKVIVKKSLTVAEIKAGIGHLCKLADGQTAFIASTVDNCPVICMHKRSQDCGWCLDASDVASKFEEDVKGYKYGWGISDEDDATRIKVVEILEEPKKESPKTSESPKTILDMTIREVLEKLDEVIKR